MRLIPRSGKPICCTSLFAVVLACSAAVAAAQDYTSIVVFGDSLSDTGNFAHLTQAKYYERIPGPAVDYTDGRFTDGTDTVPAAHNYNGVWIEQLAAMLPSKPGVKASLDGGTDYAYGDATTNATTSVSTFGPGNALSVTVDDIGLQITHYLATSPKINAKTLFVVWGGANDLLAATNTGDIVQAALNQVNNIQRLINAGATQIVVPNLPPLGAIPRLNGSPTLSATATKASVAYNDSLLAGLVYLYYVNLRKHVELYPLDVYGLFKQILGNPAKYGYANVTMSSQGNYLVNPDTYLFWDDLHPTTHGHDLLAVTAAKLLGIKVNAAAAQEQVAVEQAVGALK